MGREEIIDQIIRRDNLVGEEEWQAVTDQRNQENVYNLHYF